MTPQTEGDDMDYETFAENATKVGYDLNEPADAVTLAAWVVGPSVKRIAKFLGRPRSWVEPIARTLRENGCWSGGKIRVSDDDDELFGLEIALQCAVARGLLEFVPA